MFPIQQQIEETAAKQDGNRREMEAAEIAGQREQEWAAAEIIQRNYRGYRERRQLKGMGLEPSTRWLEAVKEARYRNATRPTSRRHRSSATPTGDSANGRRESDVARQNWKRISEVARRAGGDDTSETEGEENMTPEQREEHRQRKMESKREREKSAKVMDLQYFLEMVDVSHRHGSNLRAYHNEWKKADTTENFFYWLDKGEGKHVDLPTVSRERLEKEKVRYLSREERLNYLVKIDDEGRLRWAKNGLRISTNIEWKDSINGIVPEDDNTPTFRESALHRSSTDSTSSLSSSGSTSTEHDGESCASHDLSQAKVVHKNQHVPAAKVLNYLLKRSAKPNTWMFVADTSLRLYVGIKQSGAFQHSSFLHGARISAAGLIRIKDGQLRRLSPLSGHYRPPAANFRAFIHSLHDAGVDMSHVSVSRSYAVLIGLEGYTKTRKRVKSGMKNVSDYKDRLMHPEEARRQGERQMDKSESAATERELLAKEAKKDEETRKEKSFRERFMRQLGIGDASSRKEANNVGTPPELGVPDQDIESGVVSGGREVG